MIQRLLDISWRIVFVVVLLVLTYKIGMKLLSFREDKIKNPTKINYHNGMKYSKLPEDMKSTVKEFFRDTFWMAIFFFCCALGSLFLLNSSLLFYLFLGGMLFYIIFDGRYFIKKDWKSISEGQPITGG